MLLFACGAVMLIIGMGLFSLGADMSMMLMGEGIGTMLSTSKKRCLMVCITFVIGFIITIAEPDLTVLAHQVPVNLDSRCRCRLLSGHGFAENTVSLEFEISAYAVLCTGIYACLLFHGYLHGSSL